MCSSFPACSDPLHIESPHTYPELIETRYSGYFDYRDAKKVGVSRGLSRGVFTCSRLEVSRMFYHTLIPDWDLEPWILFCFGPYAEF